MARINAQIEADATLRARRIDELSPGSSADLKRDIQRTADLWAISADQIERIFFADQNESQTDERRHVLLKIAAFVESTFDGDQVAIVRWLRRATSALGGARPIDLLDGTTADLQRVFEQVGHLNESTGR